MAKARLRWRAAILLVFLLPQAFPNLPVYINIARVFFGFDLNGTVLGVVLVHAAHGLVYSIWIATAAFSAIDDDLVEEVGVLGARKRTSGDEMVRGFLTRMVEQEQSRDDAREALLKLIDESDGDMGDWRPSRAETYSGDRRFDP